MGGYIAKPVDKPEVTVEEATGNGTDISRSPSIGLRGKGVNVSGGRMHDVVGIKQTIVNNYNRRTLERTQSPKLSKKTQWHKLVKRHRKHESWIYPFSWDISIRLAPEDFFVKQSMSVMDRTGQVDLGFQTEIEQLFDPILEGADRPEHILIRGDGGYGKSTLCTKIAFDWANNVTIFPAFPAKESLIILYRLRDLPPESDLEEELRCFVHEYHSSEDSFSTQKSCWRYGNKLLLILDGYDEISSEHQRQVRDLLSCQSQKSQSYFKFASVILTSRPDTDQDLLYLFDKHCRLTGLSEERRLIMVNSFIRRNAGCANLVLTALNNYEDPCTKNLSPLLILMICYMCKQGGFDTKLDASQLSLQCVKLMAKRCNDREDMNLTEDDINSKLHVLGKYFYKCLSKNTLFIRASDMKAFLKEDYEFVVQFGILRSPFQSEETNEIFEPLHKQFMDALAKDYLLAVWSSLLVEERLRFVSHFVNSSSTEIMIFQERNAEYKIKISAKDRMHRANRITYLWEVNPVTGDVQLDIGDVPPMVMDLGIKVTVINQLEGDLDFFISYITKAFASVSTLKKVASFLAYFRQHIYRVKFCRVLQRSEGPYDFKSYQVSDLLEKRDAASEENLSFVPWSKITEKVSLVEVEIGETLLRTETLSFVCEYLLGFRLDSSCRDENPKEYFTMLYECLRKFHDRFYIKCVLKKPVGSKMFRLMTGRAKKVDLITFQCNYKHEHVHPREIEIGEEDRIVPFFKWDNIRSVILYFSK